MATNFHLMLWKSMSTIERDIHIKISEKELNATIYSTYQIGLMSIFLDKKSAELCTYDICRIAKKSKKNIIIRIIEMLCREFWARRYHCYDYDYY